MAEWVAGACAALPPRASTPTSSGRTGSGGTGWCRRWRRTGPSGSSGSGEMGRAAAATLQALGFDVRGWSRRPSRLPGLATVSRRGRARGGAAGGGDPGDAAAGDAGDRADCWTRGTLALLPRGGAADQSGARDADRRRGAPGGAGQRAARRTRRSTSSATEPLPPEHPVLGASAGHGDAAHRVGDPAGDRLGGDRAEHPAGRERGGVNACGRSDGGLLTGFGMLAGAKGLRRFPRYGIGMETVWNR